MNHSRSSIPNFLIFIVYAVFAILSLILVLLSSQIYDRIVKENQDSHTLRTAYSYIQNKLRNGYESIELDNDTLIIYYPQYQTRIFEDNGTLYEENRFLQTNQPVPAEKIVDLDQFSINEKDQTINFGQNDQTVQLKIYM